MHTVATQYRRLSWHQVCSSVQASTWSAWTLWYFLSTIEQSFQSHIWKIYANICRQPQLLVDLSHFSNTPMLFRKPTLIDSASRSSRNCSCGLQILSNLWFCHEIAWPSKPVIHWLSQYAESIIIPVIFASTLPSILPLSPACSTYTPKARSAMKPANNADSYQLLIIYLAWLSDRLLAHFWHHLNSIAKIWEISLRKFSQFRWNI